MLRKAKNSKQTLFTLEMAEKFFLAIKNDLESISDRFEGRFKGFSMRFESIDKRFDDLETIFENRFSAVDKRFENIDKRFEKVEIRLDQHEEKLDAILDVVGGIQKDHQKVKSTLWDHNTRILKLEHKAA